MLRIIDRLVGCIGHGPIEICREHKVNLLAYRTRLYTLQPWHAVERDAGAPGPGNQHLHNRPGIYGQPMLA